MHVPSEDRAQIPLYVRLSAEPSRRLERAASASGLSKRRIVEDAVSEHLRDDRFLVGRIALREELPEVLTLDEAAALLRVDRAKLAAAAAAGDAPARRIGSSWRFAKAALLAWLAQSSTPIAP